MPTAEPIEVERLDHLVLTVKDIEATRRFYTEVLGMREVRFDEGRVALHFGDQKINLHAAGRPMALVAGRPTPGSSDLCLVVRTPIDSVIARLVELEVEVGFGPVGRTGAVGPRDVAAAGDQARLGRAPPRQEDRPTASLPQSTLGSIRDHLHREWSPVG